MDKDFDYWFGVYLQWFDRLVMLIGPEFVFLLSIGAAAVGVQLGCEGSRKRKTAMTSAALTFTGTVAIGQGTALVGMCILDRGAFGVWWWMTAALAAIAGFAFIAQAVQHVRLLWPRSVLTA